MPAADLSSLKIHDSARTKGAAGRVLAYISAAIGALGPLGTTDDVAPLVRALGGPKGSAKDAARGSLVRLSGEGASSVIIAALAFLSGGVFLAHAFDAYRTGAPAVDGDGTI